MPHLTDSQLRAHLDGQLESKYHDHLAACAGCRARLETIRARAEQVSARMAALAPGSNEAPRPPVAALARLRSRLDQRQVEKENTNMLASLAHRWRPAIVGLAAVAFAFVLFSFSPAREAFSAFLSLFRVQQITVLPVDTTRLSELNNDKTLGDQIGRLFSDSIRVTKEPGDPVVAASAEEAGRLAGFAVRLLSESPTPPQITVQDGTAFEFTIDRVRAQAILDDAGRSDLQLPESLDSAKISVNIPTGVSAAYGTCPDLSTVESEEDLPWSKLRHCVVLAQIPSPTVIAPPDLDVAKLAEIGLQFTGMSEDEARSFSSTVDWSSTLVVPIPRNGHQYKPVQVDGVTGYMIYRVADDGAPARYTLMWVKNNIIYALTGFDDTDVGLRMANSLK